MVWMEHASIVVARIYCFLIVSTMLACADNPCFGQQDRKLLEPLPLDSISDLRRHNHRSPVNLSPDGEWVAHTVLARDTLVRDTRMYSKTGVPFAEGNNRREATITNTRTREVIRLGTATDSSWAPVWSPDSTKVAFYSDAGGQAGVWIWDVDTRQSQRFGDVIVRPFFGFEIPRWSPDGRRLVVKLLPRNTTIATANEQFSRDNTPEEPEPADPGGPNVTVRIVRPQETASAKKMVEEPDDPTIQRPLVYDTSRYSSDLAILDIEAKTVKRIVKQQPVRHYLFSPDGKHVAYSVIKGWEENSQQPNYDLFWFDTSNAKNVRLATNARMSYGIEWSIAPDGKYLAYIPSGHTALEVVQRSLSDERLVIVSTADGKTISIRSMEAPTFDPGDGELAPAWDSTGERLFAVGHGRIWEIDRENGQIKKLPHHADWRIRAIVTRSQNGTAFLTSEGSRLWAVARETSGAQSAIVYIDLVKKSFGVARQEAASFSSVFSLDAVDCTGEITFVSSGLQHSDAVRLFDTRSLSTRYCPAFNTRLDRFEMGSAKVINWQSTDGKPLRGSLLLPPGDHKGPFPLVVWVYAGNHGSNAINRFGLVRMGPVFNMHVLATRGYAVLYPDIPESNPGRTSHDLMSCVMPGIDAAIEQGFADPERLALMGQSHGAHNVLCMITKTTRFRAAIITAAVTHPDLLTDYLDHPGYYEQGQGNMGGTIWEFPKRYHENSPLFEFDQIETPLLIGQGDKDGDLTASDAIFEALQRLDKWVEYRIYHGEGHVISGSQNVTDFWERRLEFLATQLDLELDTNGRITPQKK